MAIVAPQPFMFSVKLKFGAYVVIEVPDFPIARIMTVFASVSQLQTMGIVALVTRVAVDGSFVFVEDLFVATVAGHHTMLAEQRIFGVPIVLEDQRFPVLFGVATRASLTELPLMFIVLLMASIAVG